MMRSNFLRHVVIWFIIIIVLFPVLWIFTTSIRRDNAYISTSLFSSQTTWQNYIDLIVEPKNIPALYNEISNIYSLGEPYNKMNEKEILEKLNTDFRSYEGYFTSTRKMVDAISKDASWIEANVLPYSVKLAVENVRKNAPLDLEYLKSVNSSLFSSYEQLPKDVKLAALYVELENVNSPNVDQIAEMSEWYPRVFQSWKVYIQSSKKIAKSLKDTPSEVKMILSSVKDAKDVKTLVEGYSQTYRMIENGSFSYGAWFAPVYLRKINMTTFRLSSQLSKEDSRKLMNIKMSVLNMVRGLESSRKDYLKVYDSALEDMKKVYAEVIGDSKDELERLNSNYSQLLSELNELEKEEMTLSVRLSRDASEISLFANDIIPTSIALGNFVGIVKRTLKGEISNSSGIFYDFSPYIDLTKKWMALARQSKDFPNVTERVNGILESLNYLNSMNGVLAQNANLDAIMDVKSSLPFVLIKLKASLSMSMPVFFDYIELKSKRIEVVKKIEEIDRQMKRLSSQISSLQSEVSSTESKILIATLRTKVKKSFNSLMSLYANLGTLDGSHEFLKSLSALYADLKNANFSLKGMPKFSRYDGFFNVLKMKNMLGLTNQTMRELNKLVDTYESFVRKLRERSKAYVQVNKLGFPLVVNELNSIANLYQNEYVSKIGPNLGMISRQSHDLSVLPYFSKAKSRLSDINDKSYYITQEWKSKYIPPFMRWLLNSVIVASSAAVITVLLSAFMAYPFSRFRFVGRKYGLIGLLLVQMFPTMMAMVALYLLLNFIGKFFPPLGLNTLGGLAFLYIGGGIAFNAWLIKGFFDAIPRELEEAAMVDGATRFQTFWRIILPLSAPVLAVTTILGFVGNYGDYILASIVLTGINHYTYAVGLQTFSTGAYSTNWGLMTAAALVGMLPILVIFLSLQKFIVGGLTQGSVKG